MAKPEAWRLEAKNYPISMSVQTRFGDLDPLGHVNNVAMAGIFETARIHFHRLFGRHPSDLGVRWLVASVSLNYIEEAHFPYDVLVHSGIGRIGTTSWQLLSAAFQQGQCVATCETVMVMKGSGASNGFDPVIRDIMERNLARPPAHA